MRKLEEIGNEYSPPPGTPTGYVPMNEYRRVLEQLNRYEGRVRLLEAKEKDDSVESLRAEAEKWKEKAKESEKKVRELRKNFDDLNDQLAELLKQKDDFYKSKIDEVRELCATRFGMQEEVRQLQWRVRTLEEQRTSAQDGLAKLKENYKRLQGSFNTLQKQYRDLQNAVSDSPGGRPEGTGSLPSDCESLKSQVGEYEARLRAMRDAQKRFLGSYRELEILMRTLAERCGITLDGGETR